MATEQPRSDGSSLSRGILLTRAWMAALAAAEVLVLGWSGASVAWLVPALGWLVATAAAASVAAGLRGDRGDLWLLSGQRVAARALGVYTLAELAELVTLAAGALLGLWAGLGVPSVVMGALVVAAVTFSSVYALWPTRVGSWLSIRAWLALHELRFSDAERACQSLLRRGRVPPVLQRTARRVLAEALLHLGRREDAERALVSAWDGSLDGGAAGLARLRLGEGDTSLADRLLASWVPSTVVEEVERTLLGAHRGLLRSPVDVDDAALATVAEVAPSGFADDARRLLAAAAQRRGQGAVARDLLARNRYGLDRLPGVGVAWPWLVALLDDASADRASSAPAPRPRQRAATPAPRPRLADAFEAPASAPPPPRSRRALRGAVPAEWLGVSPRLGVTAVLRLAVAVLLVPFALMVGVLGLLVDRASDTPGLLTGLSAAVLVASAFVAVIAVALAIQVLAGGRGPRPVLLLDDGATLSARWLRAWHVAHGVQLVSGAAIVGLVAPVAELALLGTVRSLVVVAPLVALYGWGAIVRLRSIALVRAAHTSEVRRWSALAARATRSAATGSAALAWEGLAALWEGDANRARALWSKATSQQPETAELLGWLGAARGEVDLERLLAVPTPDLPGPAYRLAVRRGLAALAAGQPDRVRSWLDEWHGLGTHIDNRFGDLLLLVVAALRLADGGTPDLSRVDLDDLAGVAKALPLLGAAWRAGAAQIEA